MSDYFDALPETIEGYEKLATKISKLPAEEQIAHCRNLCINDLYFL